MLFEVAVPPGSRASKGNLLISHSPEAVSSSVITPISLETSDAKTVSWSNRLVPFVALVIIGSFAFIQLSKWPNRLRYPGEEDAAEGTQLSEMVHLRQGVQIYRVPSQGEFDGAIYGPLSYLLGAAFIDPQKHAYLPLRLLSLMATLALAALCGVFVFQLSKRKLGGVLAVLLLLSTAFFGRYGVSARADMVALLLSFGGFFVFYNNRESRRYLALAAVLMLLSFFYKQQFVGAPIAVFGYLVMARQFRRALEFA